MGQQGSTLWIVEELVFLKDMLYYLECFLYVDQMHNVLSFENRKQL